MGSSFKDFIKSLDRSDKRSERRLILPREYHAEILAMRRVHSLASIKMQCLNAAAMRAVAEGDYETAERLYDELEDGEEHSERTSYELVNRLGQILPKIPVHALRRPCCKNHGIGIEVDRIEEMIYITWKDKTCDTEPEDEPASLSGLLAQAQQGPGLDVEPEKPKKSVFDFLKSKGKIVPDEPRADQEPDDNQTAQ